MTEYAYPTGTTLERSKILDRGKSEGGSEARKFYPQIVRDQAEAKTLARRLVDRWFERGKNLFHTGDRFNQAYWTDDIEEYKNLYVLGFVAGYLDEVAKLDKKEEEAGRKPRTAASATGVTVTVVNVERGSREAVYTLEISDPGYLTQPVVFIAPIPKG